MKQLSTIDSTIKSASEPASVRSVVVRNLLKDSATTC